MKAESLHHPTDGIRSESGLWRLGWLAVALALVVLMPSAQSIWIDEAFSIAYTEPDSLRDFAEKLVSDHGAEPLMPLGMFSFWAGSKIVGQSEVGLRTISALWAAVAVFLAWRAGLLIGLPWFGALLACHPFLWLYGGEIRPYSLTIAMGSGVLYGFLAIVAPLDNRRVNIRPLLLFGPLLCATNAIAVVPFGVVAAISAIVLLRRRWRPNRADVPWIGISSVFLAGLAFYYAFELARGMDYGWISSWKIGFGSLAFSVYEFLGFSGFGPGRNEIRELMLSGGIRSLAAGMIRPRAIGIVLLLTLYGIAFFSFVRNARSRRLPEALRLLGLSLAVAATTTIAVYALAVIQRFPFWGRHLAGVFPFFVLVIVLFCVTPSSDRTNRPSRIAWLIGLTLMASSLFLRFHDDHCRDDYRNAAGSARSAVQAGKTVWWVADPNCADYYELPLCVADSPEAVGCAYFVVNEARGTVSNFPDPDLIVVSKPDIHDRLGTVQTYVERERFRVSERYPAFRIYENPASPDQ